MQLYYSIDLWASLITALGALTDIAMYVVRMKDAKMRECFEKVFPELKKQREDKERILG